MYRIRFKKHGYLRFISHLDLQRAFHRALIRAELPVDYTKGFNPQVRMAFGPPLALGYFSQSEYADIWLKEESVSEEEFQERLNSTLPEDLGVLEVRHITEKRPSLNSILQVAEYRIITSEMLPGDLVEQVRDLCQLITKKKTKAGIVDKDILPELILLQLEDSNVLRLIMNISVKPTLLLKALKEQSLVSETMDFDVIHRIHLYHLSDQSPDLLNPMDC